MDELLAEDIKSLSSKSPSIRRKGIVNVTNWIQKQKCDDINVISQIFENKLTILITNLILDPSESVRESTLQLLLKLIIFINL